MSDEAEWLAPEQQRTWRRYLLGSARLSERLDADLRRFGMDLAEYEILVALSELGDHRLRMSELADAVHQSRSRLTHTITRMERSGLVERTTCPTDRRGVWAQLTEQGMNLIQRAAPSHVKAVRANLIDIVSPEDLAAVGRVFEAVIAADPDAPRPHTA
ncbi:MAG: MarR family winged helix-turn-helix transcriptional regulator [Propionibacteriaceae bacterium]